MLVIQQSDTVHPSDRMQAAHQDMPLVYLTVLGPRLIVLYKII